MADIVVGAICVIERRWKYAGPEGRVEARYEKAIVRVTPKRAYIGRFEYFGLGDPRREVKPPYLDTRSEVVEIKSPVTEHLGEDDCG